MMGNTRMIHSYHRKRVSEENLKPFGRMIGIGTIVIGVGLIAFGGLSFLATTLANGALETVGIIALATLGVAGLGVIAYAMKKYNGGFF